jgi:hypothetical protein
LYSDSATIKAKVAVWAVTIFSVGRPPFVTGAAAAIAHVSYLTVIGGNVPVCVFNEYQNVRVAVAAAPPQSTERRLTILFVISTAFHLTTERKRRKFLGRRRSGPRPLLQFFNQNVTDLMNQLRQLLSVALISPLTFTEAWKIFVNPIAFSDQFDLDLRRRIDLHRKWIVFQRVVVIIIE